MIFGIHTELPLELVTGPTPTRNPVLTSYDLDSAAADRRAGAPLPRLGAWISCDCTLTV